MSKTKNSYIAKFPFREVFTFDTIKSAIKVVKSAQEAFEMKKNFKRKSRKKETPKIEEEIHCHIFLVIDFTLKSLDLKHYKTHFRPLVLLLSFTKRGLKK